jgi:hypothetical protein
MVNFCAVRLVCFPPAPPVVLIADPPEIRGQAAGRGAATTVAGDEAGEHQSTPIWTA